MTVAKVAKVLRRHPEVIREWIREGRLKAEKMGPIWVVTDVELARFKKDQPERRNRG
jgi:excisionase family DNA binding protein